MNWLDSFTVLLQLISAVNFAYIVTHFPSKVLDIIFNKQRLLDEKFSVYTNEINADIQSLEAMPPILTVDGKSTEESIIKLKNDYKQHKSEWDEKRQETENVIDSAKDVKGSKCLFLFISLYCILTLFNIAIFKETNYDLWFFFTIFLNIMSFLASAFYTRIIWNHEWDSRDNVECYKVTCKGFMWALIIAIVLSTINLFVVWLLGGAPVNRFVANAFLSLCVILPFYPCLITILFIQMHERRVNKLTGEGTADLISTQQVLHARKVQLDTVDGFFTPTRPDFK